MPADDRPPLTKARAQLNQLIRHLRENGHESDMLPTLENVLQELDSMIRHDHLTGALNRRALMAALDSELARSQRTGHTFTLAVISIDGLDAILEKHGQQIAKQVLQNSSREALRMLRTLDSFGRIAANEFAIVMPTTWLDQSRKAIARLKGRVQGVNWAALASDLRISFCTGLTTNAVKDDAAAMLARAQEALQEAKAAGPDSIREKEAPLPDYHPDQDE